MGLDAVEIVMDVEDHFGISIQNAEAEHVRTVGDLVLLIQSRIDAAHLAKCPTLRSFLQLRSCVREIVNDAALPVRPRTKVVDVLDRYQRRQLWNQLTSILGSPPPSLRRSPLVRKTLAVIALTAACLAIATAAVVDIEILPLTLALAAVFSVALHGLTIALRIYPPDHLSTFGALSKRIAGVNVATKQLHLGSVDAILDELRPIVVETLGVDASEVVLQARFVEDLGMG